MWIKIIIIVLFLMLVVSLISGYILLLKDRGTTKRTWHSLSFRLATTALLMSLLFYGVFTGQLGSNAPWDARHFKAQDQAITNQEAIPQQPVP